MSKTTDRALDAVRESKFIFKENGTLEVLNAVMFWTNFRGETNRFGNSARTFNLAVNEEVAAILESSGWMVRTAATGTADDPGVLYFVNIKVNMESTYPPVINVYTEYRGKRTKAVYDISTVGELDRLNIQTADCLISPYRSKTYQNKVTGYLKKLNVIQEPDVEFGGKYDDWLEGYMPEDDEDADPPFNIN